MLIEGLTTLISLCGWSTQLCTHAGGMSAQAARCSSRNCVGTLIIMLACGGAVSVLWLPYQAITFLVRSGNTQLPDSPLGDTSLLLALVLLHHAPPAETGSPNPFRHSLQRLQVSCLLEGCVGQAQGATRRSGVIKTGRCCRQGSAQQQDQADAAMGEAPCSSGSR